MKAIKWILLMIFLAFTPGIFAQQDGKSIMLKNDSHYDFQTEESTMTMELINSSGKRRSREVTRQSKKEANQTMMLIRFLTPADVRGAGFLSLENEKKEESRYLFLPALKKARRISAGDDSDSFMGSDFTYEDIGDMDFNKYTFQLTGEETINGKSCYKVEVLPTEATKKTSGYSKRIYYIAKDNFVAYKIDYFDKHNNHFKVQTAEDVKQLQSPGKYRAYTLVMENLKTRHKTILKFDDFQINKGIDDSQFTIRNLERSN